MDEKAWLLHQWKLDLCKPIYFINRNPVPLYSDSTRKKDWIGKEPQQIRKTFRSIKPKTKTKNPNDFLTRERERERKRERFDFTCLDFNLGFIFNNFFLRKLFLIIWCGGTGWFGMNFFFSNCFVWQSITVKTKLTQH